MQKKDSYSLLFGQLWQLRPDKKKLLAVDVPESSFVLEEILSSVSLPKVLQHDLKQLDTKSQEIKQISTMAKVLSAPLNTQSVSIAVNKQSVVSSNADNLILNWEELINSINACTKCGLCDGRKHVVIERGVRDSRWMFVGEGPGEQEDIQGLPFVGPSGQLLDKMLTAMKLNSKSDVYICNVVKCRPPYNRNPELPEIKACNNYLLSQVTLVKPKVIVALGRFAAQTLLATDVAIGKLRGTVHNLTGNNIPVIVTYHPSYLLRNPAAKKPAWEDLQLAMKLMEGL